MDEKYIRIRHIDFMVKDIDQMAFAEVSLHSNQIILVEGDDDDDDDDYLFPGTEAQVGGSA